MEVVWKTDEQLIAEYRQGDLTAFAPLVDRYQPKLFALLVWLRYPRDDIDDLLQELWARQWKAIRDGKYDPNRGTYGPYLMRSLRRLLYDKWRRKFARTILTETDLMMGDDQAGSPLAAVADRAPSPAAEFLACVLGSALREMFAELSPDNRELLCRRFLEGLTYDELAREQGVVVSTAKKRCDRILARLRERIDRELGNVRADGPGAGLAGVTLADGCERLVLAWLLPETCEDRLSRLVEELREYCLPEDCPDRLVLVEVLLEEASRQLKIFSAEQSVDRRDVCPSAERANGHKSRLVDHVLVGLRENSHVSQATGRTASQHDLERMCEVLSDLLERLSKLA